MLWIIISLAGAVAATGFAILFNVPIKTLIICALGGAVAVVTRNILHYHADFGLPLSSFCGALVVGIVSIYLVLKVHVPAHVISIPPVIPMIPGVLMYKTMIGILGISNVAAADQLPLLFQTLESGINATLTVLGISLGVAIPNVIGRRYFSQRVKN